MNEKPFFYRNNVRRLSQQSCFSIINSDARPRARARDEPTAKTEFDGYRQQKSGGAIIRQPELFIFIFFFWLFFLSNALVYIAGPE